MTEERLEALFKQFEAHMADRLKRIEDALAILAIDNRQYSTKIAEHNIKIEQHDKDINRLGESFRCKLEDISKTVIERETTCSTHNTNQHTTIFEKLEELRKDNEGQEKQFAFYKGALVVIGLIPTILGIINMIKK